MLEVFYRSVQVSRDRFGSAICVGTLRGVPAGRAVPQGGPTLIPYAEDLHTGLDMRRPGCRLIYLPVPARRPGSARPRSTRSCGSSTGGAPARRPR